MQLEDGDSVKFFTWSIDLSIAVHGSGRFQCVSQIPVKLTLIYSVIWLFVVTLFFPCGPERDTRVHTRIFQTLCLCSWVSKEMAS